MKTEINKTSLRIKADKAKELRCKNLIAVLEEPTDFKNIGTVVRNINALGVEKLYIVDGKHRLPKEWDEMRERKSLLKPSVSAIKWSFVKTFSSTEECIEHLENKRFISIATSPHTKGKTNLLLQHGNYTQKRLAVWFGNESRGISDTAVNNCDACVQIEMAGIIESMNLATSTGIVLYEITKQRRKYQSENNRGRKTDPETQKQT